MTGVAEQTIGSERRSDPQLRSMRALTLVADRKIELRDVAAPPAPAAGEVQIRIKAIGLNHLDLWGWRGMAFAKRKLPLVVGVEAAGEIVAVGRETGEFKVGDRVVAYGGLTCGTCGLAARAVTISAKTSAASWASMSTASPAICSICRRGW